MLTLTLLRHGDAQPATAEITDHQRPLSAAGKHEVSAVARYAVDQLPALQLLLYSDAERTGNSADIVLQVNQPKPAASPEARLEASPEQLPKPVPSLALPTLYLASAGALLEKINQLDDAHAHVMMIGHNPGISDITARLAGIQGLELPTGGLVSLQFECAHWRDVVPNSAKLLHCISAKTLKHSH